MKKKPKLSQFERDRIEALLAKGHTQEEVAKIIGRDAGTISRERARNAHKIRIKGAGWKILDYKATDAQTKADNRRALAKYRGKKINEDPRLEKYIVAGLKRGWNPDEISGRMKCERQPFYASKTAIYEWLRSAWGQRYCHLLASKQYQPKPRKEKKAGRQMIPNRVGIEAKPVRAAHEFGHLEHDTFISGKKTHSKTAISVLIEPLASYGTASIKKGFRYYYCTNDKGICDQGHSYMREEYLTKKVAKIFDKIHFDEKIIEIMYQAAKEKSGFDCDNTQEVILGLRNELKEISEKESRFTDALGSGSLRNDLYQTKMAELGNRRLELELQLKRINTQTESKKVTLERTKEVFLKANRAKKRVFESKR